jgi:hypothetical protein
MYDALACNFGADVASLIRRHGAQLSPITGPIDLSDFSNAGAGSNFSTWFKYGYEHSEDHEEFYGTAKKVKRIALERAVIAGLLAAEANTAAVGTEAAERWEKWADACKLTPAAMKLAWQILYAVTPLTKANGSIAKVIIDAVRPQCDITPSPSQAAAPVGGSGETPDRSILLACKATGHKLLPWQMRALERVLGVADENDAIRGAERICKDLHARSKKKCKETAVELARSIFHGMRRIHRDLQMENTGNARNSSELAWAEATCLGLDTECAAIMQETFKSGQYHACCGRLLRLLDRALVELTEKADPSSPKCLGGDHHRALAQQNVEEHRTKVEDAWLLYERATNGFSLKEHNQPYNFMPFKELSQWVAEGRDSQVDLAVLLETHKTLVRRARAAADKAELKAGTDLVGQRVRIGGLAGNGELNGRTGLVSSFNAEKRRCAVKLEDGGGWKSVKPANLKPVPLWEYQDSPQERGFHQHQGAWKAYETAELQEGIEGMHAMGSPHYLYRPGRPECTGMFEHPALDGACIKRTPPPEVATRRIIFHAEGNSSDYSEVDMYVGWLRKVRRSGPKDESGMAEMMSDLGF